MQPPIPPCYIIFLKGCINESRVGMETILKFLRNGDGFVAIHSVAQSEDISADGIKVYSVD